MQASTWERNVRVIEKLAQIAKHYRETVGTEKYDIPIVIGFGYHGANGETFLTLGDCMAAEAVHRELDNRKALRAEGGALVTWINNELKITSDEEIRVDREMLRRFRNYIAECGWVGL